MRIPLIAGNWKMNKTHLDAIHFVEQLGHELGNHDPEKVEVVLCPPFTALRSVQTTIDDRHQTFGLGAQNMHHETEGAFTGEVSPLMLKALHVRYVILGHSERRKEMGETDELINRKVKAAIAHGLTPVLCVGETADERRQGLTFTTVEGQLRAGLAGVEAAALGKVILAYEPVWAIGTGVNASPSQAAEVHGYLRGLVSELASKEVAQSLRILYGGSVKADNVDALGAETEIDGALVGGASLVAQGFIAIVRKAARAARGE